MSTFSFYFFFFNDTATTEIYTLSLHDALPICENFEAMQGFHAGVRKSGVGGADRSEEHTSELQSLVISYAVFCLKKKKKRKRDPFHVGAQGRAALFGAI